MVKFLRVTAQTTGRTVRRPSPRGCIAVGCLFALAATATCAADARFDLTGPKVEVRVTRAGVMLPISSVPNLQPGDRLWLHPDLPPTQSVRYLMVLAFLRGTTNPPPDSWFTRIQTWDKKVRAEGVEVTVPAEAQEAVLFLAPVTGGDFTTLRSAVQGRPGIFVRASQDLAAAGFEQARIEKYIASMRELSPEQAADPSQLQEHSNLIAATLALKPNGDCVKLPPDQQYTCLTQSGTQNLLDDGHGESIIDALTTGASVGLIGTVSNTQLAGGGAYSAYVGSIVDVVHIMGSLHTARYQYIPAIAFPQQESLNLRLNTPPSFHNPKSVIVIGLPSVQPTIPPPLRAAEPGQVSCLQKPGVVLPVEGAPLVFSTSFAHDLVLHLNYRAGAKPEQQDIPLTPDAFRGGFVLTALPKRHSLPEPKSSQPSPSIATPATAATTAPSATTSAPAQGAQFTGTVQGFWGFGTFTGPTMPLQDAPGKDWKLVADDRPDAWLIAGKDRHVFLTSTGTACIESVALESARDRSSPENWKLAKPSVVDVTLDLPAHDVGALHLSIRQFGATNPETVSLVSYNEPARLEALHFHAGDTTATVTGTGLDQVRQVEFDGVTFKPAGEVRDMQSNQRPALRLELSTNAKAPTPPVGKSLTANVALQDGRTLRLPLTVEPTRPAVAIISHADIVPDTAPRSQFHIRLTSENDLPVSDALMFSLKSAQPFPRGGSIEIASPDGSLHTALNLASDSLILEDPQTLLATLQPLKAFGPSAFGPIRLRAVAPDGTAGDWLPLVTLIRLPTLTSLNCPVAAPVPSNVTEVTPDPESPHATCTLTGSGLYSIDAIAADADFANAITVPPGFVGVALAVPPPTGAVYYLRLRDDPSAINSLTLPAGPL